LRHALAGFIEHPQIKLRRGITLFRRLAQPLGRLGVFLRHARAVEVADREVALCYRIVLLRRAAKPFHRLGVILLHALAVLKTYAEIALRLRVALLRGGAHQLERIPGFADGGHYFLSRKKLNGQPAEFKPRFAARPFHEFHFRAGGLPATKRPWQHP